MRPFSTLGKNATVSPAAVNILSGMGGVGIPLLGTALLNYAYARAVGITPTENKQRLPAWKGMAGRMGVPTKDIHLVPQADFSGAAVPGALPEAVVEELRKEYPGLKDHEYMMLLHRGVKKPVIAHELGHLQTAEKLKGDAGDYRGLRNYALMGSGIAHSIGTMLAGGGKGWIPAIAGAAAFAPTIADELAASHLGGTAMLEASKPSSTWEKIKTYLGPYAGFPTYLTTAAVPVMAHLTNRKIRNLLTKTSELKPTVELQPHQQRLVEEAEEQPVRKLLYHALGSGKTLSAIGMAEAQEKPYLAVTPASLRVNFLGEQKKFTTGKTPTQVLSYSQIAGGHTPSFKPHTVVFDEAHRLRNPATYQAEAATRFADAAKQLILLSGSPIINDPADLAVPISMLTGKKMTPAQFRDRFVRQKTVEPGFIDKLRGIPIGKEEDIHNANQLRALLRGHVDYYAPPATVVPVKHEDHFTEMGPEQAQIYKSMWEGIPWHIRWKMNNDFPMNSDELQRSVKFMTGPRQVSLSPYPYMTNKNPLKAFDMSPKLRKAHEEMSKHLLDPRQKALVFSNFIDAGLTPYAAKLTEQGIPNAVFHGGLNDSERRKLVDDFNSDRIRVAFLGPSGTEGLSFRGTQLIQVLDPYWNPARGQQSEGRGLRFDSHTGLPEELQNVKVQRFASRLPLGFMDRLLRSVGFDREKNQRAADEYLRTMSERKMRLNEKFLELLREVGRRSGQ